MHHAILNFENMFYELECIGKNNGNPTALEFSNTVENYNGNHSLCLMHETVETKHIRNIYLEKNNGFSNFQN